MADTQTTTTPSQAAAVPTAAPSAMAFVAPAVAWFIPGAGHLIQKRWLRGLLLLICVVAMFVFGLAMDGKIYKSNTGDLLDILGFISDLGTGVLYILGRTLDWGANAIVIATADYGTKFIAVAGLLNIIAAVDAYHIAIGKKP
jgi:hypothetical protein